MLMFINTKKINLDGNDTMFYSILITTQEINTIELQMDSQNDVMF